MNDTPPCPNATPEWMITELRNVALALHAEGWKGFAVRIGKVANAMENAPTAPLPTVAPHLAGLVEELRQIRPMIHEHDMTAAMIMDRAIAALTQLAPLAGEVEELRKERDAIFRALPVTTNGDADLPGQVAFYIADLAAVRKWNGILEHSVKEYREGLRIDGQDLADLRQKLAASERECVRLRASADHWEQQTESWNRMAVELGCLIGVSDNEVPWFDLCKERANALRTQLAAAKLDADALAGALEEVRACIFPSDLNEDITKQVKQVLAAHRARGAAGGKK